MPTGGTRSRRISPGVFACWPSTGGGTGSAWPRPPAYRSEDFAAELVGVIERLGLADVVVAGHSMGGHNAMAFAAWHPDRLARLVVVDARPHVNYERLRAFQRRTPRPQTEFPSLAAALARFRLRPPETTATPALLRTIARHGLVRLPSGRWRYRFDPVCEQTRMPVDCWELLPCIVSPTLVVRGEHSTILDPDSPGAWSRPSRRRRWRRSRAPTIT